MVFDKNGFDLDKPLSEQVRFKANSKMNIFQAIEFLNYITNSANVTCSFYHSNEVSEWNPNGLGLFEPVHIWGEDEDYPFPDRAIDTNEATLSHFFEKEAIASFFVCD